jgi:hypothetical protein
MLDHCRHALEPASQSEARRYIRAPLAYGRVLIHVQDQRKDYCCVVVTIWLTIFPKEDLSQRISARNFIVIECHISGFAIT